MVTITSTHSLPDWKHNKALFCKSLSPKQEEDQLKEWLKLNLTELNYIKLKTSPLIIPEAVFSCDFLQDLIVNPFLAS